MQAVWRQAEQRLGAAVASWVALVLGLGVLRLAEWLGTTAANVDTGVALLARDAVDMLRGLPLWCLLVCPWAAWPLSSVRLWAVGMLASAVLLAEAALVHYAAVAGVPLGADLFAYSLSEIATTASGAQAPSGALIIALMLSLALLWAGLLWAARRDGWRLSRGGTALLLGLGLASGMALPRSWPGEAGSAPQNKLAFFVGDVWDKTVSGHAHRVLPSDPAYPLARAESTPDTLGPLLQLKDGARPNFVFIVVEGLGRSFSGPDARLGSFTPFLDELAARSLYWDNFLATQGRTFAVLPSVFGSLPFGPHGTAPIAHDSLPSLLQAEGYALRYFSGSNLEFDHQGDYLRSEGVASQFSERDFLPPARRISEWGYADGDLLQAVSAQLRQDSQAPRLSIVQTMSMHSPFMVPSQDDYRRKVDARLDQLGVPLAQREPYHRQRDIYASVLYTDEALRRFFEQMARSPAWDNTIVIITGDHRLPEIPMDTRLERYHVPLIVASPMLRALQRIRAVSSHFDIAPSVLALLSHRYGLQTPATVAWMGTGLDVHPGFRNLHTLPLQQTKTELSDFIAGLHVLSQNQLYRLGDGLQPEPMTEPQTLARLQAGLAAFRAAQTRMAQTGRLTPPDKASQRTAYVETQRTLTPQNLALEVAPSQGVVVSEAQALLQADGRLQAQAVYTQHGGEASPVFVPLLVLTDAEGRQWAEASGRAERLAPGQSVTYRLQLNAPSLPPGAYYAALIVLHPDTGKPIGQGQYHVAVRK